MTTEEKKHAMYYDLACLKGQKKHPKLLARFEDHLEEYLEGLRLELQMARQAVSERAGDAKDLHELRESAGRLIVRNTQLEEALLNQSKEFTAEVKSWQEEAGHHATASQSWKKAFDELCDQLQSRQELVIAQREAIKTLRFALASVQKPQEKPRFWGFFSRKKHHVKPLPKKTN